MQFLIIIVYISRSLDLPIALLEIQTQRSIYMIGHAAKVLGYNRVPESANFHMADHDGTVLAIAKHLDLP